MDLHFTQAEPSPLERAAVDVFLGPPPALDGDPAAVAGARARARRRLLLPTLHRVFNTVGWISPGALNYICQRLTVPPADAYGVASFYALFATTPRPQGILHVCDDVACLTRGAAGLCGELEKRLGPPGTPCADGRATWMRSPCLGLCHAAPAALWYAASGDPQCDARREPIAPVTADQAATIVGAGGRDESRVPFVDPVTIKSEPAPRLLKVSGRGPDCLAAYLTRGGFQGFLRALELGPARVIAEIDAAKLIGRGGAAFPTGRKWQAVAAEPAQPHLLVCNADESEPGTFKDRVLMELDPFLIVEGILIAAYAAGCRYGYVYVRGEYPLAEQSLQAAIEEAASAGYLGEDIRGSGFSFDLEVRRGAGAYICGEETALFNSIEGYRGEPRNKPPFPTQRGLFGKPTVVNNVETLACVPDIVTRGGAYFARLGTPTCTGTKLFCVSGNVARPGLYEVPFGTPLARLIELAGGVAGGKRLQAVLLGGAAGGFLAPSEIDVPLTLEAVRERGAAIGSGVVLVIDETVDLQAIVLRIAAFFRDESCGQCVPCRVGTVRQEELLHRLRAGRPLHSLDAERALLREIGQVMRDASICGLGQTASSAVESALAKFPGVFGVTA